MNTPSIKHVVRDGSKNITYKLWAYSQLNAREVRFYTRHFISVKKKPKRNSTYDLITVIGAGGT